MDLQQLAKNCLNGKGIKEAPFQPANAEVKLEKFLLAVLIFAEHKPEFCNNNVVLVVEFAYEPGLVMLSLDETSQIVEAWGTGPASNINDLAELRSDLDLASRSGLDYQVLLS